MTDKAVVLVAADELNRVESRADWTIQQSAPVLAGRCKARGEYHRSRLTWWSSELEKVEQQVRESGVELREQQVTGGQRFEAVIDQSLGHRLNECKSKVSSHRNAALEYERWHDFLEAMGGRTLTLSKRDYHYFQEKPEDAV